MKYLEKLLDFINLVGSTTIEISAILFTFIKNTLFGFWRNIKKIFLTSRIRKDQIKEKPKRKYFLSKVLSIFSLSFGEKMFILGILFSIIFILIPVTLVRWLNELPSPEKLALETDRRSTRILDRRGRLLYEIYVDKNYNPVEISEIPDYMIKATLAVEDDKFFQHSGIRLDSIIRALKNNITNNDSLQGGSTITQQLVKNTLLTSERTLSRKIKEAVLALLVEATYSKEQILEMYLNNISYGGTSWGVQSASQKYFGKNVWELTLGEISLLAGLPTAPTSYSPLSNINAAKERQKYVLDRMVFLGYINENEFKKAYEEELYFINQGGYIRAPHFVDFIRKDLEKRYGKRYVETGGLEVTTTLDLDLQDKVQEIIVSEVRDNSYLGFSNGAAVVLDAKKSEILAYVGSVDYFQDNWGAYDVVTALRQPGSSIKPVTYALALSGKYTPATFINDSPITYKFKGSEPYTPVNYDGKYHGNVSLRQALANSYNIPAVKLASDVGPDNIVKRGREMGLTNWIADGSYGLSVTLGGKEVRLLDHVNLYATLARLGNYEELSPYLSIRDSKSNNIYFDTRKKVQVLTPEVSYIIWDILSDNNARLPAFGVNNFLSIPGYKIAVKTGTTDNIKDNWALGYTPSYVVGVWVGNNDGSPMNQNLASGLTGAAPIWNKIMRVILQGSDNEIFDQPENVFVKKDEKCGYSEIFIKGSNIPKSLCPERDNNKDKDKND